MKKGFQTGGFNKLIKGLEQAKKLEIRTGVVKPSTQKSGKKQVSNALILKRLEKGPVGKKGKKWGFLKTGVESAKFKPAVKAAVASISQGRPKRGMQYIGDRMSLSVKSQLRQGKKSPKLEASTIAQKKRKGSSKPTKPGFDDGQLMKAIDSEIK